MKSFLKKFFDEKFLKFIIVGVINTIVGMAIMYGMYFLGDTFHWYDGIAAAFGWQATDVNFWVSSGLNYTLTSILSYVLNKNITFKSKGNTGRSLIRFIINIAVCYLISYGIARPFTTWFMTSFFPSVDAKIVEYLTMFVGMVFFTGCNYIGQRFFAFKSKDEHAE
ncbi:MAG: GtrA family protein [Acutalibacteraceae bacterium]